MGECKNKHLYSYYLEDYSNDWSKPLPDNSIIFSNLKSGEYEFKVKSFDNNLKELNETRIELILKKDKHAPLYLIMIIIIVFISNPRGIGFFPTLILLEKP